MHGLGRKLFSFTLWSIKVCFFGESIWFRWLIFGIILMDWDYLWPRLSGKMPRFRMCARLFRKSSRLPYDARSLDSWIARGHVSYLSILGTIGGSYRYFLIGLDDICILDPFTSKMIESLSSRLLTRLFCCWSLRDSADGSESFLSSYCVESSLNSIIFILLSESAPERS